jgi:hypothetical protein
MTKTGAARINRAQWKSGVDRYTNRRNAALPATGVAQAPPSQQVRTKLASVDDPFPARNGDKLIATVNIRTDLLEQERANKRITPAAYLTGRILQAVFEKQGQVGSSNWRGGDRVDAAVAHEKQIMAMLRNARLIDALMQRMIAKIGSHGTDFIRKLLTGERTFQSYAAHEQQLQARRLGLRTPTKVGDRAITHVATRFRDLLEILADELAATGKTRAPVRGEQTPANPAEDFDEKGRLVSPGEGFRWGERDADATGQVVEPAMEPG